MTVGRAAFDDAQWSALVETAARTPAAVMAASGHGAMRTAWENYWASSYIAGSHELPSELVRDVVAALTDGDAHASVVSLREELDFDPEHHPEQAQDFIDRLYTVAREAGAALSSTDADDADAYRAWVERLGLTTAEASREGGFLGIGGQRVNDAEARVLAELTLALASSS